MTLHAALARPDAETCYQAGEARHRLGDLAGALSAYDAALALDSSHGPALHLSAMAFYQHGDPAAALPRIEAATQVLEQQADVWAAYGTILMALGRANEAVTAYERGLDLEPEDGVLWFNLGLAQRGLGRLDQAIIAFKFAAAPISGAHHELGLTLQMAGRPAEAIDAYRQALALGAGAETALNAGAACHEIGDAPGAEAFYRLALDHDPGCVRALNNLAMIAQDRGKDDQATQLCRRAIVLDPAFAEARNNLGVSLQRQGDMDAALGAYRAALRIDPFEAGALANLTELLFEQGRGGEAIAHHRAMAASWPDDPRTWLALARALERGDDLDGAAQALGRAVRLDPGHWATPHHLGQVRQRLGDPAAALELHRLACVLAPGQADAWRQLALAAVKAGDGEAALAGLETLLSLDPFDPQGWACRALALRLTGQIAAAEALTDREGLVAVIPLATPPGYADLTAFHRALSADLAAVRLRAWSPRGQSLVGGFQTQNDLFAEQAAAIHALRASLDQAVADFLDSPGEAVRAFIPTSPTARRYRSWSVTVKAGGHHAPHIHPEGSLSGVYYVEVPGPEGSADLGGLEFGRPGFAVPLPHEPPTRIVQPHPGALVLFPSYLWHGTRTFEAPGERTTVAFDLLR
jgi:uncharacterized protein (TIGR02466 family)